jgi:hypothetical protein
VTAVAGPLFLTAVASPLFRDGRSRPIFLSFIYPNGPWYHSRVSTTFPGAQNGPWWR